MILGAASLFDALSRCSGRCVQSSWVSGRIIAPETVESRPRRTVGTQYNTYEDTKFGVQSSLVLTRSDLAVAFISPLSDFSPIALRSLRGRVKAAPSFHFW